MVKTELNYPSLAHLALSITGRLYFKTHKFLFSILQGMKVVQLVLPQSAISEEFIRP